MSIPNPNNSSAQQQGGYVEASSVRVRAPEQAISLAALKAPANRAYVIAGVGGLVALFGYLFVSYYSVAAQSSPFTTYAFSGADLAGGPRYTFSGAEQLYLIGGYGLLWLVPLAALVALAVAGMLAFEVRAIDRLTPRNGTLAMLGAGVVGTLVLIGVALNLNGLVGEPGFASDGFAYGYGLGFWLSLLGMLAVLVGGGMQWRTVRGEATAIGGGESGEGAAAQSITAGPWQAAQSRGQAPDETAGRAPVTEQVPLRFDLGAPGSPRRRKVLIGGGVLALIIVALVVHALFLSPPNVAGTWYGVATYTSNGQAEHQELYFALQQEQAGQITGTVATCSGVPLTVSGTTSGAGFTLNVPYGNGGQPFPLSGSMSGDTMQLSGSNEAPGISGGLATVTIAMSLHAGTQADFMAACRAGQ